MFQGTSLLALDAKGRLSLPSRYRESLLLSCQGDVTLTRHPDGCVLIYPRAVWYELRPQLAQLPYSARALQRILLGSAVDVSADSSGRLVGLGNRFELWDQVKYVEFEKAELAKGLPAEVDSLRL